MTVRTRAELNSDADTALADNTTGDIGPADVRQRVKDLADSAKLAEDIGSMAERDVTISTSDPSGGADGDVWLKYTP